jgi:hypothetical protein
MKKIVVIFGGPVNLFEKRFKIFKYFEKKFKIKIKKVSSVKFVTVIENIKFEFLFSYCPKSDMAYLDSKKYIEQNYNESVPLPTNELCAKIKKADIILFFGICGAFNGKIGEIYVPSVLREINYSGEMICIKDFNKNPGREKTFKNELNGMGKNARVITSNITLMPACVEGRREKIVLKFGKKLSKFGNVIDKESFQVVKNLAGKFKLGVGLVCSDVILEKKFLTPRHKFEFRGAFNKFVVESAKKLLS